MPTLHDEYPKNGVPIGCPSTQPRYKVYAPLRMILEYTPSYAPVPYIYASV
jgi:hypothetical protein